MSGAADRADGSRHATAHAPKYRKALGVKRMQRTATCLLAVMIALLLACIVWQREYPSLAWLRAFAEAGTVGAVADWYAVVALFRRPFGLPVPHTAIIAQSQERIAESLGNFVEENFLTPELIIGKLSDHNAAHALARWLAMPANGREIANVVVDSLPGLLDRVDEADVEHFFDHLVRPQLRALDVSRLAGGVLRALTGRGRHRPLLDHGLQALERWLTANVSMISARFSTASRYTPAPLDAYLVGKFVEGVIALFHEVAADPDHELRRQFDDAMQDLVVRLEMSPVHRRAGRLLMRDCIRHFGNGEAWRVVLDHLRAHVRADPGHKHSALRGAIGGVLVSFGKGVAHEPAIQQRLNAWWLALAHDLAVRYRRQFALLITEVVKSWNVEEVSRKIETEIGRDLQYIRINGTLVGGTVGVLLHAAVFVILR